jgi:PIN domain nuclease of toxin-antitoxin system
VEPFLDVTNVYYYLKGHDRQKRLPKETKSLATICEELLNVYLSKVSLNEMSYAFVLGKAVRIRKLSDYVDYN